VSHNQTKRAREKYSAMARIGIPLLVSFLKLIKYAMAIATAIWVILAPGTFRSDVETMKRELDEFQR
jgi:hypothetical protein